MSDLDDDNKPRRSSRTQPGKKLTIAIVNAELCLIDPKCSVKPPRVNVYTFRPAGSSHFVRKPASGHKIRIGSHTDGMVLIDVFVQIEQPNHPILTWDGQLAAYDLRTSQHSIDFETPFQVLYDKAETSNQFYNWFRALTCYLLLAEGSTHSIVQYTDFVSNLASVIHILGAEASDPETMEKNEAIDYQNLPEGVEETCTTSGTKRKHSDSESMRPPRLPAFGQFHVSQVRPLAVKNAKARTAEAPSPYASKIHKASIHGAAPARSTAVATLFDKVTPSATIGNLSIHLAKIEQRNRENADDLTAVFLELAELRKIVATGSRSDESLAVHRAEIDRLRCSESKHKKQITDVEERANRAEAELIRERQLRTKGDKDLGELLEGQASLMEKFKR